MNVETYRLNAEKCLELAQVFNDQERKQIMLAMANAWLTLAEQTRQEQRNYIGV